MHRKHNVTQGTQKHWFEERTEGSGGPEGIKHGALGGVAGGERLKGQMNLGKFPIKLETRVAKRERLSHRDKGGELIKQPGAKESGGREKHSQSEALIVKKIRGLYLGAHIPYRKVGDNGEDSSESA